MMTKGTQTSSFFVGDVFQRPEEFFESTPNVAAGSEDAPTRPKRGGGWEFSKIPRRLLLSAAAAVSLHLFSLSPTVVSASSLEIERFECSQADAGVAPPRLTREQARNARLMRVAFARIPETEEDVKGGDPDYDR